MESKTFIKHLDCYIPETKLIFKEEKDYFQSPENSSIFDKSEDFLKFANTYLGIDSVNIEKELTMVEMADRMMDRNIANGAIDPTTINHILIATDFNDKLVHYGHYLQHKYKMNKTDTFRVSENYCANIDVAFGLAAAILNNTTEKKNILIVCGVKKGHSLDKRIAGSYSVLGDAVGLALLSNESKGAMLELQNQKIATKGVLHNVKLYELGKDNTMVHFQGYVDSITTLMKSSKLAPADIDSVILHNANLLLVEQSLIHYGIKETLVDKTNKAKYGHLGTVDIILNLKTFLKNNPTPNKLILTVNIGVVGTYVSSIFKTL